MASTLYEYGTPALGGYVHGKKLFLTFPHWGVQCIDVCPLQNKHTFTNGIKKKQTKSNQILSTWIRPTMNHQFTSPITYSHDQKWLISAVYDKVSKQSSILLWNTNDLQTKNKLIHFEANKLSASEQIIRIFHSHICHHSFVIITSFGNVILFNPNTKTFDYASNNTQSLNCSLPLKNVKLHDSISSSGYHKKIAHISFIFKQQKEKQIKIIPLSFSAKSNLLSMHECIVLSLPNEIEFDGIFDYDWCFDSNELILLMNTGEIMCFEYADKTPKYRKKYSISSAEYLDISATNQKNEELSESNELFAAFDSCLLSFVRIKFIESSQFVLIGPSNKEYNTVNLWAFESQHGFLRDSMCVIPQNPNSNFLMLAPIISVRHSQIVDVFVIAANRTVSVRLASSGKSLLSLVEIAIEKEYKMDVDRVNATEVEEDALNLSNFERIKRFVHRKDWKDAMVLSKECREHKVAIEECEFNLLIDCFVENEKWNLFRFYFVLVKNCSESTLLYALSTMLGHLKYFEADDAFLRCLNCILSAKINDIFMKRCIQILPQSQVEALIKYLCERLDDLNDNKWLQMDVVLVWLNILMDSHLATLAFTDDPALYKQYILKIREYVKAYDERIKAMMKVQASVHSILNEMKMRQVKNKNSGKMINKNTSKQVHGIGGGAFGLNPKVGNQNDQNLYKDYVVEYIKL